MPATTARWAVLAIGAVLAVLAGGASAASGGEPVVVKAPTGEIAGYVDAGARQFRGYVTSNTCQLSHHIVWLPFADCRVPRGAS